MRVCLIVRGRRAGIKQWRGEIGYPLMVIGVSMEQSNDKIEEQPKTAPPGATWGHVVPFIAWLFLMHMLGDPAGWKYAVRSVACLALFIAFRPWRWYAKPDWRHLPLALLAGVVVFVVWIAPEMDFMARFPRLQYAYLKWGIMPPWDVPKPLTDLPYAPETCGWALALMRLAGSAFVISVIEEFFWRGFLYRWMLARDFTRQDLGTFHLGMLIAVSFVFASAHDRWAVGFIAGMVYGWLAIRTRDIWAASIAHAVTNLLLGIYVLAVGAYQFW